MPGEPCYGCNIPGPQLFRPFLGVCSLLIPNHPLIPKPLSGRCTKPDPAAGAADGRIIQPLNLFHLFLWLRIVREQMAIFSSVSVIRSHSLRQRWLKQIPGPLQSHHLVFPSAPAAAVGVGSASPAPEGRGEPGEPVDGVSPTCLHLSPTSSLGNAELWRLAGVPGIHISPPLGFGRFGATLSHSHGAFLCSDRVRGTHWDTAQLRIWELLLRRRRQRLFLLHLPSCSRRKWVFLGW